MKADVCTKTVDKYKSASNKAIAKQQEPPEACSFITVECYSSYAQFLTKLQDDIVNKLIEEKRN